MKKHLLGIISFLFIFSQTSLVSAAGIFIQYGDHSGSHSESYQVVIKKGGSVVFVTPASPVGEVVTSAITSGLSHGNYTAEIIWISGAQDFDYTFNVFGVSGSKVTAGTNSNLLGVHNDVSLGSFNGVPVSFSLGKQGYSKGNSKSGGDPVNLFTGAFETTEVDLHIPGRGIDFVWSRSHSGLTYYADNAPLGSAWNSPYFQRLENLDNGDIDYFNGEGRVDLFTFNDGVTWNKTDHLYMNLEHDAAKSEFVLIGDGHLKKIFYDFSGLNPGKLKRIEDRFGNRLQFNYGNDQLISILDTYDRSILLSYDADGRVREITDFAGRRITYKYRELFDGSQFVTTGLLESAEAPEVFGTSTANNFAGSARKTTRYVYNESHSDPLLKNNITAIYDPNDVALGRPPFITNSYYFTTDPSHLNYNRVSHQVYGGAVFNFHWEEVDQIFGNETATLLCITNDRRGAVTEYFMNDNGNTVSERKYTGFASANAPTTDTSSGNPPLNPLRPSTDPPFFETLHEFDTEGKLIKTTFPRGNTISTTYNTSATFRHGENNPTQITRSDETLGNDPSLLHQTSYDSGSSEFELVTMTIDPNGNVTDYIYDYDEAILGDQNDDGVTTGAKGLLVRINYPENVFIKYQYNTFGQLAKVIDGEDNEIEYRYHPSNNPTGQYPTGASFTGNNGYLKETIIDPSGLFLRTQYLYDQVGNVTQITDPRGHITTYEVNQLNQVVKIRSPQMKLFPEDGAGGSGDVYEKAFIYDANDNVTAIWVELENSYDDSDANVPGFVKSDHYEVNFTYDELDKVLTRNVEAKDSGLLTTYQYNPSEFLERIIYPNGDEDFIEYDERGFLFQTTVGEADASVTPSTTRLDYDINGNIAKTRHPNSARTESYTYDGFDRLKTYSDDAIATTVTYTYDKNSNIRFTDIEGRKNGSGTLITLSSIETLYDGLNRPIETRFDIIDHEANSVTDTAIYKVGYDKNSLVTSTTNANNHATTLAYDDANRLKKVTDPAGNALDYVYDKNNNVIRIITHENDPGNPKKKFVLRYQYDEMNRLREVEDDLGHITHFALDSRGLPTEITDAEGQRIQRRFDGLGRKFMEYRDAFDGGQITLSWDYDSRSRLTKFTDGRGNETRFNYDSHNRLTERTNADLTTRQYQWDTENNLVGLTRENGFYIRFDYDDSNRLTRRRYYSDENLFIISLPPTIEEEFEYNGLNALTKTHKVTSGSQVIFERDSRNLVLECEQKITNYPSKTFTMTYDAQGNPNRMTYPNNRIVRFKNYNNLELLTNITTNGFDSGASSDQKNLVTYSYEGYGRVAKRTFANEYQLEVGFDKIKRVQAYLHKNLNDSKEFVNFVGVYDGVHNLKAEMFLVD